MSCLEVTRVIRNNDIARMIGSRFRGIINRVMKQDSLEPGLLQLLRLYLIVGALTMPLFRRGLGAVFGMNGPLENYLWLNLPVTLFLICYITLPWWQRVMGRAFLPIALIVFAGHAILEKYVTLQWSLAPDVRELVTLLFMLSLW